MNKQEIEKAIHTLECARLYIFENSNRQDYSLEALDRLSNAVDDAKSALEQQLTNGWIPVSERLPEYTDDYNVTVGVGSELGYFEEVRTYRYEIYNGKNPHKKWIIPNNFHEVVNVIAWQPLPDPYKELATDNNVVTIGDKIRESNESLADLIRNFDNICNYCIAYKSAKCKTTSCGDGVLEYLNQPYKD